MPKKSKRTYAATLAAAKANSKYQASYCKEMLEFFKDFIVVDSINHVGKKIQQRRLPTFEEYAYRIGVTVRTLENWKAKYPKFADAYEECLTRQKNLLIQAGLTESFNPTFVKFTLSAVHGLKEKSDVSVSGGEGKPFEVNIRVVKDEGK